MKLKTLLEEFVRSMASLDPSCILTQTRVDGATNLPGESIQSAKNPDSPVSRDHAPDLDAQMESISGGGLPRRAEMAFEGLSWSFVRFGATSVDPEVHRRDRRLRC